MANDAYDPGPNGDYPHWGRCKTCGRYIGHPPYRQKVNGNTNEKVLIKFSYPVDASQVCEDLTHPGRN